MYNEAVKAKFLESKRDTTARQYQLHFEKTESYENELGKDLSEFSHEEILDMVEKIKHKSNTSKTFFRAMTSGYINWTIEQGIRKDKVNPFLSKKKLH